MHEKSIYNFKADKLYVEECCPPEYEAVLPPSDTENGGSISLRHVGIFL
jgi:hypothetical protein